MTLRRITVFRMVDTLTPKGNWGNQKALFMDHCTEPLKNAFRRFMFTICEYSLVWKQGLGRCNQVQRRSHWIRVSHNSVTGILIRSGEFEHTEGGRP